VGGGGGGGELVRMIFRLVHDRRSLYFARKASVKIGFHCTLKITCFDASESFK